MNNKGILVIVSGPSAVGKGSVVKRLMEKADERNLPIWLSVSYTTREMRTGEVEGESYFYTDRQKFEKMVADGNMLEYNEYNDSYYGTGRLPVDERINNGYNVILEIDVNGAKQVKEKYPNAVTVFVMPPSLRELESRIRLRKREQEDEILRRLAKGKTEIAEAGWYDYIVINDIIEQASDDVLSIMAAEMHNCSRMSYVIDQVLGGK